MTTADALFRSADVEQATDAATGEVMYTPPQGEGHLRTLLSDWESFLHENLTLNPLVRLAMAHCQFEAIHPFTDGNGRTGRVLNSLVLVEQGLLHLPVLYLSRHIIRHQSDYYRHLRGVTRDRDWQAWLLFMLKAVEQTSRWTLDRIQAIRELARIGILREVKAGREKLFLHSALLEVLTRRESGE